MQHSEITKYRLINQQIVENKFATAQQLVEWMGAMQAQDYPMSMWGIGARIPNAIKQKIEDEFNKGKILRTHLMRPTWHLVSSNDIYWMLQLTVPQIKNSVKSRQKELGLNHEIVNKCLGIIERALYFEEYLTREELISELVKDKIQTDNNRASHIFLCAEMERLVCSGPLRNGKQTYALLEKRVEKPVSLYPDEALKAISTKYFQSHGPANLEDFTWWSGLKVSDARKGLEFIKKDLLSEKIGSETYWYFSQKSKNRSKILSIYFLPAFDEYIISYKHRDAAIVLDNSKKIISSNGIFRPVILVNGKVGGVWKREIKRDKALIEIDLFEPYDEDVLLLVKEQVLKYGEFLETKTEIQFTKIKPLK